MDFAVVILKQTAVMALYMAMGCLLFRHKKITAEGSRSMAAVLLWLVIPAVVINSFCVEPTPERLVQMAVSASLGGASLALSMGVSRLIYRKSPVNEFAAAFSNAGFMGIPLVRACFGEEAVFFLVGFVAFLNVLQWTYGASVLSRGKAKMGWKQILLNPVSIGLIVGVILFITGLGVRLPEMLSSTVRGLSALNGPLAMLVLGVYLGQTDPRSMVADFRLLGVSTVRLLLIPAITLGLLALVPGDRVIRLTILAAACAPVGSNAAVYAQMYGEDYPYACQTVAMSTVFSIVTMPLVLAAGGILFQL